MVMKTVFIMVILVMFFANIAGCIGISVENHQTIEDEIGNMSLSIPIEQTTYTFNLPNDSPGKTYCISLNTKSRESHSSDMNLLYTRDYFTTTTDKFGSYGVPHHDIEKQRLGSTNINSNALNAITVPNDTTMAYIEVNREHIYRDESKTPAIVDFVVSKCNKPNLAKLVKPLGTIVNCSDYRLVTVYGSNVISVANSDKWINGWDGWSWSSASTDPNSGGSIIGSVIEGKTYLTTEQVKVGIYYYGTYQVSTNLTVVNATKNQCKVV
jgi:hypothetical protein